MVDGDEKARYRCEACGNLTRFDVQATHTVRERLDFSLGGERRVETLEILSRSADLILCRWCGSSREVVRIDQEE